MFSYHKSKKVGDLRSSIEEKKEEICALNINLKQLHKEKEDLQCLLDFSETPVVKTFENGKYVDSIRELYIKLFSLNVGRNNVKTVLG